MRLIYDSTSRSSFPQKRESRIIPNIIYRFLLSQERQRFEICDLQFEICLLLDRFDTPLADGLMFWMMTHTHIVVPASFTLFTLCPGYYCPHLFFVLGLMKGDRGDNKD
jgi:hypothetical protein